MKRTVDSVEALGGELGVDLGRPAVLVLGRAGGGFARRAFGPGCRLPRSCDHFRLRESGQRHVRQSPAQGFVHHAPVRADIAAWLSSAQSWRPRSTQAVSAIGPSTASTMSARLIAAAGRASCSPPPAPRVARSSPRPRQQAHQLLHRRHRQPGFFGQLGCRDTRHPAMARGGAHRDDGVVGHARQAHIAIRSQIRVIRSDFT